MRKRKSQQRNQTVAKPKFLARLDPDSDEPALIFDVGDPDKHIRITEAGATYADGATGCSSVHGFEAPYKSESNTHFDDLFKRHGKLFKPGHGTPEDIYEVFRAWAFSHAARDFLPVRPIAVFTGPPGSTKSTTASAVAQLYFGSEALCARPMRLPSKESDFKGELRDNPIIIIDNLERSTDWLADCLCLVSASDARLSTRELYTTADSLHIIPDVFIAVTSFSAQGFIRGDLLARSLVFTLQPPPEGYMARTSWAKEVDAARHGFLKDVIRAMKATIRASKQSQDGIRAFDRLRDFAWVGEAICREFSGEIGVQRFRRGMASIALARLGLATSDADVAPIVTLAALEGANETWYDMGELLKASAAAVGADKEFVATQSSASQFGKWMSTVAAKTPGILDFERRLRGGRTQYRVSLPDWVGQASAILAIPASDAPVQVESPAPVPPTEVVEA